MAWRLSEQVSNKTTYLILLGNGYLQTVGDFEFDGDMLCAEFDLNGKLVDCSAAQASLIKYQGETILDATVRHKIDSQSKYNSTIKNSKLQEECQTCTI